METFVEAFPEQYLTAMEAFAVQEEADGTRVWTGEEELAEETSDAFCRNVAGWEYSTDGGMYGIR